MTVETATKISQLDGTAPPGTDPRAEGDNHLRLIKTCLKAVFDDSGTTLKTTLPIESPAGAKLADVTVTGNATAATLTVSGNATAATLTVTGNATAAAYVDPVFTQVADLTKKVSWDMTAVAAATTRKVRVPDADVALSKWEFIQTVDMAGKGSQNFLNLGAFQFLKLTGVVQPASGTTLSLRTSTNNGTSFDSGATDYATQSLIATTTSVASALTSAAQMAITNNVTTFGAFETLLFNFNKAFVMIATTKTMVALGANWATEQYGGTRNSGVARNALYFGTGGAACTSGTLMLEGVRG